MRWYVVVIFWIFVKTNHLLKLIIDKNYKIQYIIVWVDILNSKYCLMKIVILISKIESILLLDLLSIEIIKIIKIINKITLLYFILTIKINNTNCILLNPSPLYKCSCKKQVSKSIIRSWAQRPMDNTVDWPMPWSSSASAGRFWLFAICW